MRTIYPKVPVIPVRTASQIPREMIFRVMEEINKALITGPVGRGETVIPDVYKRQAWDCPMGAG